jgi:hypothetical protein
MATVAKDGVFADEVFTATELNRRGGTILDHARRRPVTITRNNEQFALLRREQAAELVGTVTRIAGAVSLLSEAHAAIGGGRASEPFRWLEEYGMDDLQKLFLQVLQATRRAASGECGWDDVEALVHEWRESAMIARSGVLDAAMRAPSDEAPLEDPTDALRSVAQDEAESTCPTTSD